MDFNRTVSVICYVLLNIFSLDTLGQELRFNAGDPTCKISIFDGTRYHLVSPDLIKNKTTEVAVIPGNGKDFYSYLIDGKWYSSTPNCFLIAPVRSPASTDEPDDGATLQRKKEYEKVPVPHQRAFELYYGLSTFGTTIALNASQSGAPPYTLVLQTTEAEFGVEKNFPIAQQGWDQWSLAVGMIFGLGISSVTPADVSLFTDQSSAQLTYTQRLHTTVYYYFSDSFKFGAGIALMASDYNLPTVPSPNYSNPGTFQWSVPFLTESQLHTSKTSSIRLGLGWNQFGSRFFGSLGLAYEL